MCQDARYVKLKWFDSCTAEKACEERTLLSKISARCVRVTCANSRHMRCVRRQLSGKMAQISALAFSRRRSQA